jgi:hypothetical protein
VKVSAIAVAWPLLLVGCPKTNGPYTYLPPDADASYSTAADAGVASPDLGVTGPCPAYCAHLRTLACAVEVAGGLPCEDTCARLVAMGTDMRFACAAAATSSAGVAACCPGGAVGCSRACAP